MRVFLRSAIVFGIAVITSSPAFGDGVLIPQSGWTLRFADSQETATGSYAATNAFDGNPDTFWATQWLAASPSPPHELQIDLGATYNISGIRCLPRQDGHPQGRIREYEIYVSVDGLTWGAAVASGSFEDSATEQQVLFASKPGRYLRLRALSEVNGQPWSTVAELNVLSTGSVAPGPGSGTVIPRAAWTLRSADSQETTAANNAATNAFDGNPNTFWATQWWAAAPPPPHELQINLGAVYPVSGFRYLPRQDGLSNGDIAAYEFYVSADGVSWGTPVATGVFPNDATEKEVTFAAKSGRFVRLRALSEVQGRPWTAVAEVNVLAAGASSPGPSNQAPDSVITSPAGNATIATGQSVTFSGSGTDPDNNLPLTYSWSFGAGGPPATSFQNPGAIAFPVAGVYTVTLTVTDALGNADPTPATRVITVQAVAGGAPATPIPRANWTLRFADSQETTAANNAATNAFDGDPNTFWATQWLAAAPPPPHELQIDLGATYSISGIRYLPRQDGHSQGRIREYEIYVSADGLSWGAAVASGSFEDGATEQQVLFASKSGRYLRLRALSEVNGQPWSTVAELNVLSTGSVASGPGSGTGIPRGAWTLRSADSQETTAANNAATNAFDGNPSTFWATQWWGAAPPPPHDLQINLGGLYDVGGFRYLPRQDGLSQGGIGVYQFYVSSDGVNWGTAVASGTFPNTSSEQQVVFTPKTGRYVRLRALTEINGQPWTTVAELSVLGNASAGGGNQLPQITLSAVHDPATSTVSLAATAADPDGTVTRVDFYFGGNLISTDTSAPFTATMTSVRPGTYSFMAAAEDNVGARTTSTPVSVTVSRHAVFTASTDHATLLQGYVLEVFTQGANPSTAAPLATLALGKPPVVNGECDVDISGLLAGLSAGNYIATISAVGDAGSARSDPAAFFAP